MPRLRVRLAEPVPKLLASAVDSPKSGDPRTPTGGARFTWFRMFWPWTEKPRLYLRSMGFFFAALVEVAAEPAGAGAGVSAGSGGPNLKFF